MSFHSVMDRIRSKLAPELRAMDVFQQRVNNYLTLISPVLITIFASVAPNTEGNIKVCLWTLTAIFSLIHIVIFLLAPGSKGAAESAALAIELQQAHDSEISALKELSNNNHNKYLEAQRNLEMASRYLTFNKLGIITISDYLEKEYLEDEELKSALTVIINAISCYMGEIFGISESESWSLTVYIPKGEGGLLKCISGCRSRSIDDKSEFRDIPIRYGHIGMVYDQGNPLINEDMQSEQLQGMFQLPPAYRKNYDADRYRAFASFPVRFPGRDTVLGVIGLTSDVPGRFTSANTVLIGMLEPHIGMLISKLRRPMLMGQLNPPASSGGSDGEQN